MGRKMKRLPTAFQAAQDWDVDHELIVKENATCDVRFAAFGDIVAMRGTFCGRRTCATKRFAAPL